MSSTPDFEAIYKFAITLAMAGGKMIAASSTARSTSSASSSADASKKNRVDLVTETDQAVEKFVQEEITKAFPDHAFIGEESYAAGQRATLTVGCFLVRTSPLAELELTLNESRTTPLGFVTQLMAPLTLCTSSIKFASQLASLTRRNRSLGE